MDLAVSETASLTMSNLYWVQVRIVFGFKSDPLQVLL